MDTKICRTCGVEHNLDMFNRNKKHPDPNYRIPDCNTCRSLRRKEQTRKLKAEAVGYMGGKCQDCSGVFHQSVFEFHHLDPTTKERDPGTMFNDAKVLSSKTKAELDKCVLLCANCHRVRHWS